MVTETDALQGCSSPRGGAAAALYAGHSRRDGWGCVYHQTAQSVMGGPCLSKGVGFKAEETTTCSGNKT